MEDRKKYVLYTTNDDELNMNISGRNVPLSLQETNHSAFRTVRGTVSTCTLHRARYTKVKTEGRRKEGEKGQQKSIKKIVLSTG